MAFDDSFVEEVRRSADIVRTISEHVPLKRMGTSWKGLCPFHKEKSPSFNVRAEPPLFHCFGCGEGGDVFKFVMLHERLSFPEALESLARRHGVPIPEGRGPAGPGRQQRDELLAALAAATERFESHLWSSRGSQARDYLLGRGFSRDTLEHIRAGAAADAWDDVLEGLRRRFPPQVLVDAGLVLRRKDGSGFYDRFRNRAMFPIFDEGGRPVGFGARSLDGSEPKYLNSPETPAYHKGRVLYGLHWARTAVREAGRIVLMEGYLDVARAIEAGCGEAVATCGTALTPQHARLLHRYTETVHVNFDQDAAGVGAARKGIDVLVEEGMQVHVVVLPEGHDPDSFLAAEGAEAYRERLATAPPYMEWLVRRSAAEHDVSTPAGKAAYLNALLPALARVDSAVERAAWLPLIVDQGALDERAAGQELRRALAGRRDVRPEAVAAAASRDRPAALAAERWLLSLLVHGVAEAEQALGELHDEELDGLRCREALLAARRLYLHGEPITAGALDAALEAAEAGDDERRLVREAAMADPPDATTAHGCVAELRRMALEKRLAEIQRALARASGGSLETLLQEKLALRRQIASL